MGRRRGILEGPTALRVPSLVALMVLGLSAAASAQEPTEVRIGDRVRATLRSRLVTAPLIGTVTAVSRDTLVVELEDGRARSLAAAEVERVELGRSGGSDPAGDHEGQLGPALFFAPVAILLPIALIKGGAGGGAVVLGVALLSVATATTYGDGFGSDPEDLWLESSWPPSPPDEQGLVEP
jgi:hypothetical protein